MATGAHDLPPPASLEGIFSLLDTDLYKLTMQCCVLKYFPEVQVKYHLTNRTPNMRLSRGAVKWMQTQIDRLGNITLSEQELLYLRKTCTYLNEPYLRFMSTFRLRPAEQVHLSCKPVRDTGSDDDPCDIDIYTTGTWVDTILYEIPLLALISEAYFKFVDRDWSHDKQVERAQEKGRKLLEAGCLFSEFGSRRRRDHHTQDLVLQGLTQARAEAEKNGWAGKLTGTSNVHFAMKHGLTPVGTVAHEWFMGVAAITNDYENASETSLRYWVGTFGEGVLGIALTDTYGTPTFLEAFRKPIPSFTTAEPGLAATMPSAAAGSIIPITGTLSETKPPIYAPIHDGNSHDRKPPTYAQVFTGVRQDSGDPEGFVKMMKDFYDGEGIKDKKTIVFSDSLNIDLCLKYKAVAEAKGLQPSFGVGTFFTNDFVDSSTGEKSVPLNIVIKIWSAQGRPAVKISDNIGKNTGDPATVKEVKQRLGYEEKEWAGGDESKRWNERMETSNQP